MSDIPEQVTEVIADGIDEVAEQTHHAAELVRSMGKVKIQFAAIGAIFGAAAASIATYYITVSKLDEKYKLLAEEEIDTMREHYQDKILALEERDKPDLAEIVAERG